MAVTSESGAFGVLVAVPCDAVTEVGDVVKQLSVVVEVSKLQ